jgi:hypothetical protein
MLLGYTKTFFSNCHSGANPAIASYNASAVCMFIWYMYVLFIRYICSRFSTYVIARKIWQTWC